ncbi:MAG: electron transfer flavoprotein subunit alpha/FixB family protein [Acidimicrobiia bacterium]|nr:MAG: electron transfer flavoprotein subunit alpha/FixB family protein [Acidimicrobiia bacterium]
MANDILVFVEHLNGDITDATYELLATARSLAAQTGGSVDAAVIGTGASALADDLGGADRILVADTDALGAFNPQGHAEMFASLVETRQPAITLVPYTSVGMDIGNHVAATSGQPLVSYCLSVDAGDGLSGTCQLYSGKVQADVQVEADRAVFAMLAGAASADDGRSGGAAVIENVDTAVPDLAITFIGTAEPEAGDVDITTEDILVAIGRGIESEDNIEEAQALADALGAALAASRPIIDQGWLPKTRQVGKSGLSVKPKVYLALGISGAPEHLEGMRDSSTIIAVNSDPQAPIFGVAHYGWAGDLFDFIPELTDRLEG